MIEIGSLHRFEIGPKVNKELIGNLRKMPEKYPVGVNDGPRARHITTALAQHFSTHDAAQESSAAFAETAKAQGRTGIAPAAPRGDLPIPTHTVATTPAG
ncbi:hypothetical protein [Raineyella sp.]|uniref:hypothetical protein n=1 Tax=Raineyella sp. TaxID=1911550 RepID=UPI002B1F824D|nr:hypothetical protein [Raineyella sp.]MEA5154944.1 hypothetical protein [Raineyella sp.]